MGLAGTWPCRTIQREGRLTQGEESRDGQSNEQKNESEGELASFADGGEEWTASSSLPNLMQGGIHVPGLCACAESPSSDARELQVSSGSKMRLN